MSRRHRGRVADGQRGLRLATWLSVAALLGCAGLFPFNVNLIPLLDPTALAGTVEPAGGPVTLPVGAEELPSFELTQIPLHDVQLALNLGLGIPDTPIEEASVALTISAGPAVEPAGLAVDGTSSVALYIAPDDGGELFASRNRVPMGLLEIGTGEPGNLEAPLDDGLMTTIAGRTVLLGVEFADTLISVTVAPSVSTVFEGFSYSITALRITGNARIR